MICRQTRCLKFVDKEVFYNPVRPLFRGRENTSYIELRDDPGFIVAVDTDSDRESVEEEEASSDASQALINTTQFGADAGVDT